MLVLGINGCSHNTGACLVRDGELIAFVEEERFNREKHSMAWPALSIRYCLEHAGAEMKDLDAVALAGRPRHESWISALQALKHLGRGWYRRFLRNQMLVTGAYKGWRQKRNIRERLGYRGRVIAIDHHLCHAASAFLVSPYERAGILTVDALGDGLASCLYMGEGTKIKRLKKFAFPRSSLGHFYDCIGEFCGFRAIRDAGKTMGLASYGDESTYRERLEKVMSFGPGGEVRLDLDYTKDGSGQNCSKAFQELFGEPRTPEDDVTSSKFTDMAAAGQEALEKGIFHLVKELKDRTGCTHLTLAGGVALNSVANGKVLRSGMFEDIWIQPAANDAGLAVGAAFQVYNGIMGKPRSYTMTHAFYGPSYTTEEIRQVLEVAKIPYREVENPSRVAAELVAQDKIVGWYQGRMETGPRALGNRSILANPRNPEMKDIVNKYVKHRESFRPFAPSAQEEYASDYFDIDRPNPYMLIVCDVRPEKRDEVPAITHVDGTGRLQTIAKDVNPRYWELIDEFRKITGTPLVLNTSFNIRGEPIVATPQDALKCYFATGLDAVVVDRFLVIKNPEESRS